MYPEHTCWQGSRSLPVAAGSVAVSDRSPYQTPSWMCHTEKYNSLKSECPCLPRAAERFSCHNFYFSKWPLQKKDQITFRYVRAVRFARLLPPLCTPSSLLLHNLAIPTFSWCGRSGCQVEKRRGIEREITAAKFLRLCTEGGVFTLWYLAKLWSIRGPGSMWLTLSSVFFSLVWVQREELPSSGHRGA